MWFWNKHKRKQRDLRTAIYEQHYSVAAPSPHSSSFRAQVEAVFAKFFHEHCFTVEEYREEHYREALFLSSPQCKLCIYDAPRAGELNCMLAKLETPNSGFEADGWEYYRWLLYLAGIKLSTEPGEVGRSHAELLREIELHMRTHWAAMISRLENIPTQLIPEELRPEDYRDLSLAVVLFTEFEQASFPQRNGVAVVKEFGGERATTLLGQIRCLFAETDAIKIDWEKHTLATAGDHVRAEIEKRYPGLSDKALDALAWKWTFENR